ncbi:DUF1491 family protein [Allosphingosinicella flava]|uniref:DUF1491 family protein n=1 Tax=Allosphingosinicella flava TaxID=2771430 RepID=A0A7T2LLN0_9SPHN|nr:DUF1491 family protein [Sphingosinicella flava]QPQ54548.1 DUF1491 family protein [Sphingosinicella flava]
MTPRLASSVLVSALLRKAQDEGGFGAVLFKGDEKAGEIIVILNERGQKKGVFQRFLQADGLYSWQGMTGQVIENEGEFSKFIDRRRRFDPDLWLIELDIASAERFAAEMNAFD